MGIFEISSGLSLLEHFGQLGPKWVAVSSELDSEVPGSDPESSLIPSSLQLQMKKMRVDN
jgi:hypothetical protein